MLKGARRLQTESREASLETLGSSQEKGKVTVRRPNTEASPQPRRMYSRRRTRDTYDLDQQASMDYKRNGEPGYDDFEIPNTVFDNHVEGNLKCKCNVCDTENTHKKEIKYVDPSSEFFNNFNFEAHVRNTEPEKDFVFILKRLIPPKQIPYTLRLFIPETVCFTDGEAKFIALTEKVAYIKSVNNHGIRIRNLDL